MNVNDKVDEIPWVFGTYFVPFVVKNQINLLQDI